MEQEQQTIGREEENPLEGLLELALKPRSHPWERMSLVYLNGVKCENQTSGVLEIFDPSIELLSETIPGNLRYGGTPELNKKGLLSPSEIKIKVSQRHFDYILDSVTPDLRNKGYKQNKFGLDIFRVVRLGAHTDEENQHFSCIEGPEPQLITNLEEIREYCEEHNIALIGPSK